ncbi:MAG: CDP-glucose 4,6-dehydratase [Afipia sp.]
MNMPLNREFWRGKRVLITGHTGFKGAWLTRWLASLDSNIIGLSLPPTTAPNLHDMLATPLAGEYILDLSDAEATREAVDSAQPDIVLHLAAQSLVPESYRDPVGTFRSNFMGTIHLLDAIRSSQARAAIQAIVVATTDKVYANDETGHAFNEGDRLGGDDPYSASKAAVEIAVHAWRHSFATTTPPLGTVRAGNVIGGGDWAPYRLLPDIVRAARSGKPLDIRRPNATRPWQHVLDPLHGYLLYAQALASGNMPPPNLNFAPADTRSLAVREIADSLTQAFGIPGWQYVPAPETKEKDALALDASLAFKSLGWKPSFSNIAAIATTVEWYKAWAQGDDVKTLTDRQIESFEETI